MIRKETINTATNWLNELSRKKTFETKDANDATKKHGGSRNYIYLATQIGFFQKTSHGKYISTRVFFEPIHGRQLIEKQREKYPTLYKKVSPEEKKTIKPKSIPVTSQPKKENALPVNKKKNEVSILWGLIKVKY